MFSNFAWSEMLVIAAVAIIVVGPKDLPGMLRQLGKSIGGIKRMAGDFQRQFNDAIKEADLDEIKDMTSTKGFGPLEDARKSMEDFAQSVNDPLGTNETGTDETAFDEIEAPAVTPAEPTSKPAAKKAPAKKATAAKSSTAKTPRKAAAKPAAPKAVAAKKAPAKRAAATTKSAAKKAPARKAAEESKTAT